MGGWHAGESGERAQQGEEREGSLDWEILGEKESLGEESEMYYISKIVGIMWEKGEKYKRNCTSWCEIYLTGCLVVDDILGIQVTNWSLLK